MPPKSSPSPPQEFSESLKYIIYIIVFVLVTCWAVWKGMPWLRDSRDEEASASIIDERSALLDDSRLRFEREQQAIVGDGLASGVSRLGIRENGGGHKTDLVHTRTLDPGFLPSSGKGANSTSQDARSKRLIIIGDVHGCKATLTFNPANDHLVFAGDIINKGPDSIGVVELAMKYGASCVRGNHEDRILRLRESMGVDERITTSEDDDDDDDVDDDDDEDDDDEAGDENGEVAAAETGDDEGSSGKEDKNGKKDKKKVKEKKKDKKKDKDKKDKKGKKKDKKGKKGKKDKKQKKDKKGKKGKKGDKSGKEARERHLASILTPSQAHWLSSLPLILRVGQVKGMGEVIVVHAGLIPGIEVEKQDPWTVMNMRSIDKSEVSDTTKGEMWAGLFNNHQSKFAKAETGPGSKKTTVIYGHDSKTSLAIRDYTKGLDSGCVKGEKLTALVIEEGGKQGLVQVKCQDEVEE